MVTKHNEAIALAKLRRESLSRVARQYPHFVAEPDTITGGHIVRNVTVPGPVELERETGECTCKYGRMFGVCRHMAIVEATGQGQDARGRSSCRPQRDEGLK